MTELPFKASRKLESLRRVADEAAAKCVPLLSDLARIENDLAVVTAERARAPEDRRVEYDQVLSGLRSEMQARDVEMIRKRERATSDMAIYNKCREWCFLQAPTVEIKDMVPQGVIEAKADVGELERVRAGIAELADEIRQLKAAPLTSAELTAQIRDYVNEQYHKHSPRITVHGGGLRVSWDSVDILGSPAATFGVLCWAAPELAQRRLEREVADLVGSVPGVAAAERESRIRSLTVTLHARERLEEAVVTALLEAGHDVARRADASPQAILNVVVSDQRPMGKVVAA